MLRLCVELGSVSCGYLVERKGRVTCRVSEAMVITFSHQGVRYMYVSSRLRSAGLSISLTRFFKLRTAIGIVQKPH